MAVIARRLSASGIIARAISARPIGLRQGGAADPISILGDKLAAWYVSEPSTLFTTSTGETPVTAAGEPVGLRVNRVSGGPNAIQATAAARPTYQVTPSRLVYDASDDALNITVPTGGWSGTFFNATTQGVTVGTISVAAGTYQLPTNPIYKDSINNDVGIILCDGVASAQEIADTIQWLRDNAGAGDSVYTGSWQDRFRGRTDITSFDIGHWDTSGVTGFFGAWFGCSSLTSFPPVNTAAGTTFQNAWFGCTGLTDFPLINTAAGTTFQGAWQNCSSLTSFPPVNTAAGTTFQNAWLGCTGLTDFPLINVLAGTNFQQAWRSCTSLADFPANFFDGCLGTSFNNVFLDTALTQTSIDNILVSINSNGTSNGTFNQSGGSAPSATGQAAIDAMRARGWTVTVTGGY